MKRLDDQIALKWEKLHSVVMGMVGARWVFAIFTFACVGPGSNGEVDMAWMMVQDSPIFLTLKHYLENFVITQMYKGLYVCVICYFVLLCHCKKQNQNK